MTEREMAVKCLRELRNLLTDDTDLKLPIHDEKFLMRFVRADKYDAKKAQETVRKYYTLRKNNPKIFKIAYPSYEPVTELLKKNVVMKLKHNDPAGLPIITWNFDKWEVEKSSLDQSMATFVLVLEELLLFSVDAQINGIVIICNEENLSLQQTKQLTPEIARAFFQIFQGSFPIKLKKTLIVKEPSLFDVVLMITKPFMSAKFKERMKFIGYDMEKLHNEIPAKYLPKSYGGLLSDEEAYDDEFRQHIINGDSYYQGLLNYGFGTWDSDGEDTYIK